MGRPVWGVSLSRGGVWLLVLASFVFFSCVVGVSRELSGRGRNIMLGWTGSWLVMMSGLFCRAISTRRLTG